MKNFLIFGVLLTSSLSFGEPPETAAIGTVFLMGATIGSNALLIENLSRFDLRDWKNQTRTSIQLENQCGLASEFRVVGNQRTNGIFISLKNIENESVGIKPEDIIVRFASARERRPDFYGEIQNVELRKNQRALGILPLPNKADFRDQDSLDVLVPTTLDDKKNCTITAHIVRDPKTPHEESTSVSASRLEVTLGMGASVLTTQDLQGIGKAPSFAFDLSVYGFRKLHHGLFANISVVGLANGNQNTLQVATLGNGGINDSFFGIGYSHRTFLSETSSIYLDLGFGERQLSYRSGDSNVSSDNLGFTTRLSYDYRFARNTFGPLCGDHSIGLSIVDLFSTNASMNGVSATGHDISTVLRYKWGI